MTFRFRKAIVVALLGAVLALVLAACGGDEPTATPTNGDPTATPPTGDSETATPTSSPDFDAEAYFSGKTIRMIVGFGQGGGTDAQGRYFARHWGRYIPGNPQIVVQNITPVINERNYVWNQEPDGLVIATEATPGVSDMALAAAEFDMREVSAIGSTSGGDAFWALWNTLDYDCADSAVGQTSPQITLGDGIASVEDMEQTAFAVGLAAKALDLPLRLIHIAGDTGSAAQKLMLERGDTNSWSTATVWYQLPNTNPGWVTDGTLKPFLDMSSTGVTMSPNEEGDFTCGKLEDYAEGGMDNEDVQDFYTFNDVNRAFAKNIVGPPDMDPNVLNTLRQALDDAMNDPEFANELETQTGIPNNYTPGAEFEAELQRITDAFLGAQDRYESLRQEVYDTYVQ